MAKRVRVRDRRGIGRKKPRGAPVKFKRGKQQQALRLIEKKASTATIAKMLGLSYATIHNWKKGGCQLRAAVV